MTLLRSQRDDFIALIGAAAEHRGIRPVFVEKDYWVTEVLRSVVAPVEMPNGELSRLVPIFKGGTSLSKVYGLIRRFSEDVDVLLTSSDEGAAVSGSARNRALSIICGRVAADTGTEGPRSRGGQGNKSRIVEYEYAPSQPHEALTANVRLDIGVQGGPEPHEPRSVRSYLAEYALEQDGVTEGEFAEFAPVELCVLRPERTLAEKLMCLHGAAGQPSGGDDASRVVRHYYDVHALLGDAEVRTAIENPGTTVPELADAVSSTNRLWKFPSCDRPEQGFASSVAFDLEGDWVEEARAAYADTLSQLAWQDDYPSFDECVQRVREHTDLL